MSVWFESPVAYDREVSLSGTPAGELLDLFSITIPAGQVLGEAWIDTRLNHASFSDVTATLQASEPSAGTVSQSITVHNYTGTQGIPLTFLAMSFSNDTDHDGVFEAGENADVLVEVANLGTTSINNVILTLRVLNTTNLRILGGSPFQCNLGFMARNAVRSCTKTIQADSQLPTGDYFLEVVGTSTSPTLIDQGRIHIVNRSQPDLTLSVGTITSNPLPPGSVVDYRATALNDADGFIYPPASPPFFRVELEVEGQRTVLYDRVYANARGDIFSSEDFRLPIVYPSTPGTHAIYSRIDPQGLVTEGNETNNEGEVRFITVRPPNQPPSFTPLNGPWNATSGVPFCNLLSATDPDGNSLTFTLLQAPTGATLSRVSTTSARFCWTPTENDGPATYPVGFEVVDNGTPPLNDSAYTTVVVERLSDLAVSVSDGLADAVPGVPLAYDIEVTNAGPHGVTNLSVRDNFPPQLLEVAWTCTGSAGGSCGAASGQGPLDTTVSLQAGGRVLIHASGVLEPQAEGTIANQAEVLLPAGWSDPNPTDNQATDTTLLRRLDWGDAPDSSLGSDWSYPVRISAEGARHGIVPGFFLGASVDGEGDGTPEVSALGDDQSGLADEDGVVLPSVLVVCTTSDFSITASAPGFLDAWVDWDGDGVWTEPGERVASSQALSSGNQTLSLEVPCESAPGASRFARFRFGSTGGLPTSGLALDGEVEDHSVTLAALSDLSLTLAASPEPPVAGTDIAYTATVSNAGPSPASAVVVDFDLAPGLLVNGTNGCQEDPSGYPQCTLGTLPAKGAASVALFVSLPSSLAGAINTEANVSSGSAEANPGDEGAALVSVVAQVADLAVTKDNGETVARPGTAVVYQIGVTNAGPSDAAQVTVFDAFPPELDSCSWVCAPAGNASCTPGPITGPLQDVSSIPAHGSVLYQASCMRGLSLPSGILNQAEVTPELPVVDPATTNNTAEDLDFAEFVFQDGFESGDTSAWDVTVQ